jgi:hypothetical protein
MRKVIAVTSVVLASAILVAPASSTAQNPRNNGRPASKPEDTVRFADQFGGNTVSEKLDAAARDCGASQCLILIPSTMGAGAPTIVANNISWLDLRRTATLIAEPKDIAANTLFQASAAAGTSNRVFGFAAQATATGGGPVPADPGSGELVSMFSAVQRTGGTRPIWALNTVTDVPRMQRTNAAYGLEIDINNNDTDVAVSDASADQVHGLLVESGGTNKPGEAIRVMSSGAASRWQEAALLANWSTDGLRIVQDTGVNGAAVLLVPSSDSTNGFIVLRKSDDKSNAWEVLQNGTVLQHAPQQFDNDQRLRWKDNSGAGQDQMFVGTDDALHILAGVKGTGVLELQNRNDILKWSSEGVTIAGARGLRVDSGVDGSGTGVKHLRAPTCTTPATPLSTCTTTVIWPGNAFVDNNYTAVCTVSTVKHGNPFVVSTANKTASKIDVVIATLTAADASGVVDCISMHN